MSLVESTKIIPNVSDLGVYDQKKKKNGFCKRQTRLKNRVVSKNSRASGTQDIFKVYKHQNIEQVLLVIS